MAGSAALAKGDSGFDPLAALLSLLGHGLAMGAVAVALMAPAAPEPAQSYAILFEAEPAAEAAAETARAAEPPAVIDPVPAQAETVRVADPPPAVEPAPAPAEPLVRAEAPPPPKPRPRPAARPQPVRAAAVPVESPAPAEAPVRIDAGPAAGDGAPAPSVAAAVEAPPAVAVVAPAPPAPIPVVTEARFRERPSPPVYPRRAIELGLRGIAVLRALVQPDGTTAEIVLWRSSGVATLDDAALGAVRLWRFEPARRDGDAIVAWVEIPVRFELN